MQYKKLPYKATIADLTSQQAEFVRAFVELGAEENAAAEAALLAGYGCGVRKDAEQYARRELLRNPRVQSAIRAEICNEFVAAAPLAVRTLMELCRDATPSVRLSAAQELLNRSVGPVISRRAHLHAKASLSIEDIIEAIDAESAEDEDCGPQSVIDAECLEVEDASEDE